MTSSPPDRTLHCYYHDQDYVSQCEKCFLRSDARVAGQRPESYSTKGPAVVGDTWKCAGCGKGGMTKPEWDDHDCLAGNPPAEKPKLSVEQVHAELRELWRLDEWQAADERRVRELIDQLPRVDVVEECIRAGWATIGGENDAISPSQRRCFKVSVRRYLELKGLPADPDLESR